MIQKGSSAKKSKKGKRQTPKKQRSSRKDQIARSKQGILSRVGAMTGSSNPENMQKEKVLPKTEENENENETKTESGNEHQCSNRLDGHESKNENTKELIC